MATRVISYLAALTMAVVAAHPAFAQYGVRSYYQPAPAPAWQPNPYYAPQPYTPIQPYPVPTAPLSAYMPKPPGPPPGPVVVVPFGAYGSTVR